MEITLERFENCILGIFSNTTQSADYTENDFDRFQQELYECRQELRRIITGLVLNADDPRKVEYRIQQLQHQLICLAGRVDELLSERKATTVQSQYYKNACQLATSHVEVLLTFLEQNFSRFINMDEKIPSGYKRLVQREMRPRIKHLKAFMERLELQADLFDLVIQPGLELVSSDNDMQYSYHDMWYMKRLYNDLYNALKVHEQKNVLEKMIEFLIGINFNAPSFLRYYTKIIAISIGEEDGLHAQIEKLSWWQKEIAHMYQSASTPFRPQLPGTKESLRAWIKDELKHLEKVHELAKTSPSPKSPTPSVAPFTTSFSVPELACFFRIMSDMEIFKHATQQELITFFSSHFKTRMAPAISPNSFKNHYYDISPKSAKAVRGVLIEMINKTRGYE